MEEKLRWLKQFIFYVFSRFGQDRCSSIAAELTVTSLLSLVPLLTVIFALLALFPQVQHLSADVQSWIFENFIPESSQAISNYLNEYINNTKGLTSVGAVMLVVTSLMLMRTIDKSFNHIWQVRRKNSPVRVFLVYWAVLTMGPLLLALSLGVSSYFASLPLISDVVASGNGLLKRGVPMLMSFIAFTVMFIAVPNRSVAFRNAAIAALCTAILFETAKWGFGVFVRQFSTYQLIFGAIASIPLFLIWVLLSWMLLLFGAEICHALDVFQPEEKKRGSHPFIVAARVIKLLAGYQKQREVVALAEIQSQLSEVKRDVLFDVLELLHERQLLTRLEMGGYCLTGDSEDYTLADLLKAGLQDIPSEKVIEELANIDEALANQIKAGRSALLEKLNDPLVNAHHSD
ncbi:YihY family inner membrane protein [Pleionea sp. CnH1-48]|uniref:YihY family inner membrane protein n=1 Tax=Pleionea sp. CnH1-48 TaxID=2954494 RepID=UPI002096A0B1|nr:YihY family inner membrane protein [Pleionea sp. CnH1-48]MCO7223075.1 YihY family inner membrane protein [Pleionea sp. CnH1-48]